MRAEDYQRLSEIDHILKRSDTFVGSKKIQTDPLYVIDIIDGQWVGTKRTVSWCPAVYKIIDEVLTNASDHAQRNMGVKHIDFRYSSDTGEISVWNDGKGIPVQYHPTEKTENNENIWVPELIFGYLRTGSNYDDTQDRYGAGRNGYGAKLANVFSTKFCIECEDSVHKYVQIWENNMGNRHTPKVTKTRHSSTCVKFIPDWSRFDLSSFDEDHMAIFRRRLADIAVFSGVKVTLNGEIIPVKTFKDYVQLFHTDFIYEKLDDFWEFAIIHNQDQFEQLSIVNGTVTTAGGTHIDWLSNRISNVVQEIIEKKNKGIKLRYNDVKNKMEIFLNFKMANPEFNTQSKEKLSCAYSQLPSRPEIPNKLINKIISSEITQSILDWYDKKKNAEEKAALREANKALDKIKVLKLIEAKSTDREKCSISIFEGDSAVTGVRQYRDPMYQAAFPLRGKFKNISELSKAEVLENEEVKNLLAAIGLKIGEKAENIRYGKILIYTDADYDGDSITGLLINFFGRFWPELFDNGIIWKVETPLLVAKNSKKCINFYTEEEFSKWKETVDASKWAIEYKKGLGALEDEEYMEIIKNPRAYKIVRDENFDNILNIWFGKDSDLRKNEIFNKLKASV